MGHENGFYIPLGNTIITPESMNGRLEPAALDVLIEYYKNLLSIARRGNHLQKPLNLDLNYVPRIVQTANNGKPHHITLPLFEAPYLVATGILSEDIQVNPKLNGDELAYREIVGLGFVKILEIMNLAYRNQIDWSPMKDLNLKNGRDYSMITARRGREVAEIQYVPSLRELCISWFDEDPVVIRRSGDLNFKSLQASMRMNSCIFYNKPDKSAEVRMDLVVAELDWQKAGYNISRIKGRRRLTDDLLGEKRHHILIGTGDFEACLVMTGNFMAILNVDFLKPRGRRFPR